jgi:hypothetical protein
VGAGSRYHMRSAKFIWNWIWVWSFDTSADSSRSQQEGHITRGGRTPRHPAGAAQPVDQGDRARARCSAPSPQGARRRTDRSRPYLPRQYAHDGRPRAAPRGVAERVRCGGSLSSILADAVLGALQALGVELMLQNENVFDFPAIDLTRSMTSGRPGQRWLPHAPRPPAPRDDCERYQGTRVKGERNRPSGRERNHRAGCELRPRRDGRVVFEGW